MMPEEADGDVPVGLLASDRSQAQFGQLAHMLQCPAPSVPVRSR